MSCKKESPVVQETVNFVFSRTEFNIRIKNSVEVSGFVRTYCKSRVDLAKEVQVAMHLPPETYTPDYNTAKHVHCHSYSSPEGRPGDF